MKINQVLVKISNNNNFRNIIAQAIAIHQDELREQKLFNIFQKSKKCVDRGLYTKQAHLHDLAFYGSEIYW